MRNGGGGCGHGGQGGLFEGPGWSSHLPVWAGMASGSGVGRREGLGLGQGGGNSGQEEQGRAAVVRAGLLTLSVAGSGSLAVQGALEVVDDALERQSPEALLEALQDPALALHGVRRDFADWYLEQLSSDREQKAQVRLRYLPLLSAVGWGTASYLGIAAVLSSKCCLRVETVTSPQSLMAQAARGSLGAADEP